VETVEISPCGNWRKGGILLSVANDAHVSRTSKNIYLTERVCVCTGAGAAVLRGERFTDSAALAHMTDLLAVFEK
jgi:hypothetical protein